MKINKIIIKVFIHILIIPSFQYIFSMEQDKISEQQLQLQKKLKEAISKFDLKAVKIAFAQGAKVNLETPTILPNQTVNTTPMVDALMLTHIYLEAIKKASGMSKTKPIIGAILSILGIIGTGTSMLLLSKGKKITSPIREIGTITATILGGLMGGFLGYTYQLSVAQKADKERYKNLIQILKLIISQKEFKLDNFSKNLLYLKFNPELNKIVKTLLIKKSQQIKKLQNEKNK